MTSVEPVLFILWHRAPGKGERWRKAGRYGSRTEAVNAIGGGGDWRLVEVRADESPALTQQEDGSREEPSNEGSDG